MKTRKARVAELESKSAGRAQGDDENMVIINLDRSIFMFDASPEEQARARQEEVAKFDQLLNRGWTKKGDCYTPVTPAAIAEYKAMEETGYLEGIFEAN
jgi:hypothetical protein